MQKFDIEDGLVPSKNGLISLSKKTLILVGVLISIVFVGSILATYFGKPSCEKNLWRTLEKNLGELNQEHDRPSFGCSGRIGSGFLRLGR